MAISLDLRDQCRLDLQVTSPPAAPPTLVPPFPGNGNNHRKRVKSFDLAYRLSNALVFIRFSINWKPSSDASLFGEQIFSDCDDSLQVASSWQSRWFGNIRQIDAQSSEEVVGRECVVVPHLKIQDCRRLQFGIVKLVCTFLPRRNHLKQSFSVRNEIAISQSKLPYSRQQNISAERPCAS